MSQVAKGTCTGCPRQPLNAAGSWFALDRPQASLQSPASYDGSIQLDQTALIIFIRLYEIDILTETWNTYKSTTNFQLLAKIALFSLSALLQIVIAYWPEIAKERLHCKRHVFFWKYRAYRDFRVVFFSSAAPFSSPDSLFAVIRRFSRHRRQVEYDDGIHVLVYSYFENLTK